MQKQNLTAALLGAVGGCLCLSSCVNDDYDLNKDIDMTIQVGGDLTVPTSETSEMKMKDILDLEEDDVVRVKEDDPDSTYYLIKGVDEPTTFGFSIDPMTVDDLKEKEFKLKYKIPSREELLRKGGLTDDEIALLEKSGWDWSQVSNFNPDSVYTSDPIELDSAFNILDYKFELPKEVVGLNYIHFEKETMQPDFTVQTTMPQGVVHLEEVYAEFPSIMVHSDFHKGGDWTYTPDPVTGNHIYKLPKITDLKYGDKPYPVGMEFLALDMRNEPWLRSENPDGCMELNKKVQMYGKVTVEATAKEFLEMAGDSSSIVSYVTLYAPTIEAVDVRINPDVDKETTTIELNDLPEFLTENEVTVVLKQPAIRLNTSGNFPVLIDCWGSLTTFMHEDETAPVYNVPIGTETLPQIHLDGTEEGGKAGWCIYDGEKPEWNVDGLVYDYYQADGLRELIKEMPDLVKMDFDASIDPNKWFTMQVDHEYQAEVSYQVEAPLALGAGSQVIYTDTIDEWNEDIADYEVNTVRMTARLLMDPHNSKYKSPFSELDLKATAIDLDKNEVPGVRVNNEKLKGLKDGDLIEILLTCENGSMKNLDGLVLEVTAKVKDEEAGPLRATSTIQLTDISVGIVGGVIADLN